MAGRKTVEFSQVTRQAANSAATIETTRQDLSGARRAHQEAAPARDHIRKSEELAAELQRLELERDRGAAEAVSLDGERGRLADALGQATGWYRRQERKRLSGRLANTDQHITAARARSSQADELLTALSRQLIPEIEEHRRAARPHNAITLFQLETDVTKSEEALQQSESAYLSLMKQVNAAEQQVTYARQQPQPTDADVALVSLARERQLPEKRAQILDLEESVASLTIEINKLENQYEQVMSDLSKQGQQVARQLISSASVVAATLARLRLSPDLYEREYDHVIVEEVAAACPPEVIYAASRAREGVTLLGDFLQNGPILPDKFRRSEDPAVQRWYHNDCFAIFGIRDPETAQAQPGCVVLNEQYRFGPVINQLANEVAYGGVLQVAGSVQPGGGQEVVLVDVDGLGDVLTHIRTAPGGSSKWWPVGALLARALATQHVSIANSVHPAKVGIITPYKAQQEILQNLLSESNASPHIEAGTSHQFQGREFETLIFDLVETVPAGSLRSYMQPGASVPSGLRVFNVAVTRTPAEAVLDR